MSHAPHARDEHTNSEDELPASEEVGSQPIAEVGETHHRVRRVVEAEDHVEHFSGMVAQISEWPHLSRQRALQKIAEDEPEDIEYTADEISSREARVRKLESNALVDLCKEWDSSFDQWYAEHDISATERMQEVALQAFEQLAMVRFYTHSLESVLKNVGIEKNDERVRTILRRTVPYMLSDFQCHEDQLGYLFYGQMNLLKYAEFTDAEQNQLLQSVMQRCFEQLPSAPEHYAVRLPYVIVGTDFPNALTKWNLPDPCARICSRFSVTSIQDLAAFLRAHPDLFRIAYDDPDAELLLTPEIGESATNACLTYGEVELLLRSGIDVQHCIDTRNFRALVSVLLETEEWGDVREAAAEHAELFDRIGWQHILSLYSQFNTASRYKVDGNIDYLHSHDYVVPRRSFSPQHLRDVAAVYTDPAYVSSFVHRFLEEASIDANALDKISAGGSMKMQFAPHVLHLLYHYVLSVFEKRLHTPLEDTSSLLVRSSTYTHFNVKTKNITLMKNSTMSSILDSLAEEIAHMVREERFKERFPGVDTEVITHEFFGFLGRKIVYQDIEGNTDLLQFFRDTPEMLTGEDMHPVRFTGETYHRALKHWRQWRGEARAFLQNLENGDGEIPGEVLEKLSGYEPTRARLMRALSHYLAPPPPGHVHGDINEMEGHLVHKRGYMQAMRVPFGELATIDLQQLFSLSDQEVRHRYFGKTAEDRAKEQA